MTTPSSAPSGPKSFTLTVTPEQLQVIAAGLGELALRVSLPTLQELQKQVAAQEALPTLQDEVPVK